MPGRKNWQPKKKNNFELIYRLDPADTSAGSIWYYDFGSANFIAKNIIGARAEIHTPIRAYNM